MNNKPEGWIRRGYELKRLFLGRPIRPFHLAVMLATGTVGYTLLRSFSDEKGGMAFLLGIIASIASGFLFLGWWVKPNWKLDQQWFAEWGLLLALGVWLSRAFYVLISDYSGVLNNTAASVILSVAWAVGSGGAYLLERYDHVMEGSGE